MISTEIILLSIRVNLLSIDFPFYFQKKSPQKVFAHNRVPSNQVRFWGSGSLMAYPAE